jgi:hypothetical protein
MLAWYPPGLCTTSTLARLQGLDGAALEQLDERGLQRKGISSKEDVQELLAARSLLLQDLSDQRNRQGKQPPHARTQPAAAAAATVASSELYKRSSAASASGQQQQGGREDGQPDDGLHVPGAASEPSTLANQQSTTQQQEQGQAEGDGGSSGFVQADISSRSSRGWIEVLQAGADGQLHR